MQKYEWREERGQRKRICWPSHYADPIYSHSIESASTGHATLELFTNSSRILCCWCNWKFCRIVKRERVEQNFQELFSSSHEKTQYTQKCSIGRKFWKKFTENHCYYGQSFPSYTKSYNFLTIIIHLSSSHPSKNSITVITLLLVFDYLNIGNKKAKMSIIDIDWRAWTLNIWEWVQFYNFIENSFQIHVLC